MRFGAPSFAAWGLVRLPSDCAFALPAIRTVGRPAANGRRRPPVSNNLQLSAPALNLAESAHHCPLRPSLPGLMLRADLAIEASTRWDHQRRIHNLKLGPLTCL